MALTFKEVRQLFQVPSRGRVRLRDYDPGWAADEEFKELTKDELKARAAAFLEQNRRRPGQGAGAALRVRHAFGPHRAAGVGCRREGRHDQARHVRGQSPGLPDLRVQEAVERGARSQFPLALHEGAARARPHRHLQPVLLRRRARRPGPSASCSAQLPDGDRSEKFWQGRYDDINAFEQHLTRNGTLVLKFLLNVSKKVQRERFLERLDRPEKHWKFSVSDLEERKYWSEYQTAFEQMIQHTSTKQAPWWVIPADNKWVTRALVAGIITRSIERLGPDVPEGVRQGQEASRGREGRADGRQVTTAAHREWSSACVWSEGKPSLALRLVEP